MFAWTEAGKEILEDEFDVVFEEEDNFEESVSEVKNLTVVETECIRELIKMLSLNHDNDPSYIKVLDILSNGIDESDQPWKEFGCMHRILTILQQRVLRC